MACCAKLPVCCAEGYSRPVGPRATPGLHFWCAEATPKLPDTLPTFGLCRQLNQCCIWDLRNFIMCSLSVASSAHPVCCTETLPHVGDVLAELCE